LCYLSYRCFSWTNHTYQLTEEDWQGAPKQLGLPFEIIELMNAFPFGLKDCRYTKLVFVSFLPSRERAVDLADLYYRNAAWM
jgi:hypothetical protein